MVARLSFLDLVRVSIDGFRLLQDRGEISPRELRLTKLELLNDFALVASIIPSASDSMGIKIEACTVMSFMVSFFTSELALPPTVKSLGVRALAADGDELMYVLSSLETARYCAEGKAIEWLTNSVFQDNTLEYRRARAKLLISRSEIGLRRAICLRLERRYGAQWWPIAVPKAARDVAARASGSTTGAVGTAPHLLEYTYLPHLKEIVLQNWDEFKDILRDPGQYGKAMDELNAIRRDEAHNRPITSSDIVRLEAIYGYLAGAATTVDPEAVPGYLVEYWRQRLSAIVEETSKAMPRMVEADRRDPQIVRRKFEWYVGALREGLVRIRSVLPPAGKEELQRELEGCWSGWLAAAEEMKAAADVDDMERVSSAAARHDQMRMQLRRFEEKLLLSELGH